MIWGDQVGGGLGSPNGVGLFRYSYTVNHTEQTFWRTGGMAALTECNP